MAPSLGTATLELTADTGSFSKGIGTAKVQVQGLGKDVQALGAHWRTQTVSLDTMMHRFQTGFYNTQRAASASSAAVKEQTYSVSQLMTAVRNDPMSTLAANMNLTSISANTMKTATIGAAAAFVTLYGGSKFLGWMAKHSESTAEALSGLDTEVNELSDHVAGDLAPAVDAGVNAFSAMVNVVDTLYGKLTGLGDLVEGKFGAGGKGAFLGALLGGLGGPLGIGAGAFIGGGIGLLIEKFGDDTEEVTRKTRGWAHAITDVVKESGRALRVQSAINAEVGPRGGILPDKLPTVFPGLPPAEWIGQVKGVYSSVAEFVEAQMTKALYPTQETTAIEAQVQRIKDTLSRFEVLSHEQTGGLTQEQIATVAAQQELLKDMIGEAAAQAFIEGLPAAFESGALTGGALGEALFKKGRTAADQFLKGFQSAEVMEAIENVDPSETVKRGMEQVKSAGKLEIPGLTDAITDVNTLDDGLGSLPNPTISVNYSSILNAMSAAIALRNILLTLPGVGGGGGLVSGPGGERGGVGFAQLTTPTMPTLARGGGQPVRSVASLIEAGRSATTPLLAGRSNGPLIQQQINGLTPEEVTRQTRRAFRQLAVEFGGAG